MVPSGGRTSLCREVFYERLEIVLGYSLNSLFAESPSLNRLKGTESFDHVLVILPGRLASVFAVTLDEPASERLERHLVSLFFRGIVRDCACRQTTERRIRSAIGRTGLSGAFVMGLEHGAYWVGCCWALMLLLFAGGVMNLTVIAALTAFVTFEKPAPLACTARGSAACS
jgi:predicted metal-binding integral membrane protein DUF2182